MRINNNNTSARYYCAGGVPTGFVAGQSPAGSARLCGARKGNGDPVSTFFAPPRRLPRPVHTIYVRVCT